ncbi:MAG: M36 family metallopeptidase [Bacteroidia bacterium]|nr:M36 family metallopeptidase [Bacteroidia bacterium]
MRFLLFCSGIVFWLFSGAAQAQESTVRVQRFVEKQLSGLALTADDFSDAMLSDDYQSGGFRYVYFQQQHRGIRVFNGLLNVVVPPSGKMSVSGNRFVSDIRAKAKGQKDIVGPRQAVLSAFNHLGIPANTALTINQHEKGRGFGNAAQKLVFSVSEPVKEPVTAELVWVSTDSALALGWNIRIRLEHDWWEVRVSALSGEVIEKNNWVSHCSFDSHSRHTQAECPETDKQDALMGANDYQVFDLPLASPAAGGRTVINSPWLRAGNGNNAITLGWHNDGSTTYTRTRGNNVYAKEDVAADNEASLGYSPNPASADFSFPFTVGAAASVNRDAAITNLFFWNNLCHDVFYQYGFDEPSGNFQKSNMGRGGLGNDFVYADAMDGSGTNNANFMSPPDGSAPRMQMYLWNAGSASSVLKVNSPSGIAGNYTAAPALFNPATPSSVTGNLILTSPADGCAALTNSAAVAGKIVVIDRGSCTFVTKVKNAQNAGAIGVIIVNNVSGAPINMGGTDGTINILSCMVTGTTGSTLKNGIQAGTVNGTIQVSQGSSSALDASFDNGVITHEYGHGISIRLTGGPGTASCLSNAEQMGEGWSDFFALMLTTNWSTAQANDSRAIANYVVGETLGGKGIREYPYSYDMGISPYNYNYARMNTAVHDLGSAWASMLWDMAWNIIAIKPASTDIYHGDGGNNIALRLVMEGLKLQPCNPGFVDGRDAILKADELLYGSAYRCAIWNAFARRGLGLSASQGSRNSASDGTQAFDAPQGLALRLSADKELLSPGDSVNFSLQTLCECSGNQGLQLTAKLSSKLDYVSSTGGPVQPAGTVGFDAFNLNITESDTQYVKTLVNGSFPQPTIQLSDDAEDGPSKWNSVHLSGTGFPAFTIGANHAHSGLSAWFIPATTQASQTALVLSNPVIIQPDSWFTFWHYQEIEPEYDGGVVEISSNGGSSWQDLGSRMSRNGYNGTIAVTDNSLQGRPAFTGVVPMRQTAINLSDFSGQEVLLRFRYGTDTQNGALQSATGWFIDDMQLTYNDTCVLVWATVGNSQNTATDSICLSIRAVEPVITELPETGQQATVKIYPNPTHDRVWIEPGTSNTQVQARLISVTGQVLQRMSLDANKATALDLSGFPPAAYLLEVQLEGKTQMFRLIRL